MDDWEIYNPSVRANVAMSMHENWYVAIREKNTDIKDHVCAMWIIQDCNMGGSYYRVIRWLNNSPLTYMDTIDNIPFDMELKDMKFGDITTYSLTGNKYKVIANKYNNKFRKLLVKHL